jgi:tripartite-type tricarboxylate transporter receptor subunit TctC
MAVVAFASKRELAMEHIAYRGGLPAITDVAAGVVPIMYGDVGSVINLVQSGKVRPIAGGGPERLKRLPEIPTMTELGYPEMDVVSFAGLAVLAPAHRFAILPSLPRIDWDNYGQ